MESLIQLTRWHFSTIPAHALAFLDHIGPTRPSRAPADAHCTAKKTWIGRVDCIEPGHDLRLSTQSESALV